MGIVYGICWINICLNNEWINVWLYKASITDNARLEKGKCVCLITFCFTKIWKIVK